MNAIRVRGQEKPSTGESASAVRVLRFPFSFSPCPLRPLCSLCFSFLFVFSALFLSFPAWSQAPAHTPILTIDEDCPAFAFAPDGRIAFAVRRILTVRRIDMQRDDIWMATLDGKKKRIVNGEKLVQSAAPFSYAIQSLRWSPDGTRLTVEMLTSVMLDERGTTREGILTLLLEDTGKEIKIQGADSAIPESFNAAWLGDGVTVAYLTEATKPRLLFAVNTLRPIAGRGQRLFEKSAFAAVAWDTKNQGAVAIERDATLSAPPRLVWLDLQKQTKRDLAALSGYLGQLTLSPSGMKAAYFTDVETLEIRNLNQPENPVRLRLALGPYQWAPDESRILLKRGMARKSGDLTWIRLPDGKAEPALHSLTFRDFEISPDGRYLGVTLPGRRALQVFAVP